MEVAIGFKARTGRTVVVVVGGTVRSPEALLRTELSLSDPKRTATYQPYHAVMDLPWDRAKAAARPTIRIIESIALRVVGALVRQLASTGMTVIGAGVVGSADRDLAKIPSAHIRAHAAEGVLFRMVLEHAAAKLGLPCRTFEEKTLPMLAAKELKRSRDSVVQTIAAFKQALGPPWRADHKVAALAAWLSLATRSSS